MENLPIDIIDNILRRLPTKSAVLGKGVCKTWRNLIGNFGTVLFAYANLSNLSAESGAQVQLYYGHEFDVKGHGQDYTDEMLTKLDRVTYSWRAQEGYFNHHIVGSYNGLVCLRSYNQVTKDCKCVGICNPLTGEFVNLPGSSEPVDSQEFGFGYLPATNEYKVVRCSYLRGVSQEIVEVEVYTLGSQNGWRKRENIPYMFIRSGIFANGAIHWIGMGIPGAKQVCKIVAFDLADEKFKDVTPPPFHLHNDILTKLELLRGNLCVIQYDAGHHDILVWALKNRNIRVLRPRVTRYYYDHNWSWSKEFTIAVRYPGKYACQPFMMTKSTKVLLSFGQKKLYCYDINTSTFTELRNDDGKGLSCLQAIHHRNTLVSLKDLGECSGNSATSDNGESSRSNESVLRRSKRRKC